MGMDRTVHCLTSASVLARNSEITVPATLTVPSGENMVKIRPDNQKTRRKAHD